jgi:hypothetical protein
LFISLSYSDLKYLCFRSNCFISDVHYFRFRFTDRIPRFRGDYHSVEHTVCDRHDTYQTMAVRLVAGFQVPARELLACVPAGSNRSSGILETAFRSPTDFNSKLETLSPAGAARGDKYGAISPIHPSHHHLSSLFVPFPGFDRHVQPRSWRRRAAALVFGTTAFLDRQRGVVAAMAPAVTSGHNARDYP